MKRSVYYNVLFYKMKHCETRCKCNDREGNSLGYLLMINHGINFTKYNNTTHIHSAADLAAIVPTLSYLYAYSHQKMQSTK